MKYQLALDDEIIVDNFAGGGGASCGIEKALQRPVNIAINHDEKALAMHEANHPLTQHIREDVWAITPEKVTRGRKIALAWFSPDCKHFSKAKGGKPVEKKIRGLAWVVMKWASLPETEKPRVIILENVEEFTTWGPLTIENVPDPQRKGETFKSFVRTLQRHGYAVEWRELRACDYGAPTIRKRLFLIARCDRMPIVWPKPTHGPKGSGLKPYRTAAECIDWSIPTPSIFAEGRKLLAENTMRRIAKGFKKFVIEAAEPFIVRLNHGDSGGRRAFGLDEPLPTVTQKLGEALVTPYLTEHANASTQRVFRADEPLRTQCAQVKGGHFALVSPYLAGVGGRMGQSEPRDVHKQPVQTITAKGDTALITPIIVGNGGSEYAAKPRRVDKPFNTVTPSNRDALIAPLLASLYTSKDGEHRCHDARDPLNTVTGTPRHAVVAGYLAQHNNHRGTEPSTGRSLEEPISTITSLGTQQQLVTAHLQVHHGASIGSDMEEPVGTVTAKGKHSLCTAFLAQHNGQQEGVRAGRSLEDPISTITQTGKQQQLVTAHMTKMRGTNIGDQVDKPLHTISAGGTHHALTTAYLVKYYGAEETGHGLKAPLGTVTTKDRFGLIQVETEVPVHLTDDQRYNAWVTLRMLETFGAITPPADRIPAPRPQFLMLGDYIVVDIGMRMLDRRELFRAMSFPESYVIDRMADGTPLTKTDSVKMCGNSVPPILAEVLTRANVQISSIMGMAHQAVR